MGKKGRKWKETVPMDVVVNEINNRPIEELLPIAKIVCPADYAVWRYTDDKEKDVRRALRRCIAVGAFEHRKTIIERLRLEM